MAKELELDVAALSMTGFQPFEEGKSKSDREDTVMRILAAIRHMAVVADDPGYPVKGGNRVIRALCDRAAMEFGFDALETLPDRRKEKTVGENLQALATYK